MSWLNIKNFGIKALQQYLLNTGCKIIICIADKQYTYIWFTNGDYEQVSSNIKQIKLKLSDNYLFRSHESYLVNLNYIIHIDYDNLLITMEGGHTAKLRKTKVATLKLLMANREIPEVIDFVSTNLVERKSAR